MPSGPKTATAVDVIAGFGNVDFAADVFDGTSGFNGLQHCDDLVFCKSGFAHSDLLNGT